MQIAHGAPETESEFGPGVRAQHHVRVSLVNGTSIVNMRRNFPSGSNT